MSKTACPLMLPAPIKAARLAREDGVSLKHWIASAAAQKVARWRRRPSSFGGAGKGRSRALSAQSSRVFPTVRPILATSRRRVGSFEK